jgi:hypothetical protein
MAHFHGAFELILRGGFFNTGYIISTTGAAGTLLAYLIGALVVWLVMVCRHGPRQPVEPGHGVAGGGTQIARRIDVKRAGLRPGSGVWCSAVPSIC